MPLTSLGLCRTTDHQINFSTRGTPNFRVSTVPSNLVHLSDQVCSWSCFLEHLLELQETTKTQLYSDAALQTKSSQALSVPKQVVCSLDLQ